MFYTIPTKQEKNPRLIAQLCLVIVFLFGLKLSASNHVHEHNKSDNYFVSDVEGITQPMLSDKFWQNKLSHPNKEILSAAEIRAKNIELLEKNEHLTLFESFPESMTALRIKNQITSISKKPTSKRFNQHGKRITDKKFALYIDSLNLSNIPKQKVIQFGLVVKRSNLRTFPTDDKVFKTNDDVNLDRFQETATFPAEIVAILHQSKDKKWFFVTTYNYSAWIKKSNVALGTRKDILSFKNNENFLVVTGDKVFTTANPYNSAVSEVQLDMGVTLPLVEKNKIPATVGGQNTYTHFVVRLPTRNEVGNLEFEQAMIPRNKDVNIGYLPFNRNNIVGQAFKFLGERYGWGHSLNARDCTGFVGEVYKSFGILMPRNTGQQANSQQGDNIHFSKAISKVDKIKEIEKLKAGDLIYIPGHVMMFLGLQDGKPYIIHDVSGLSYYKEDGQFYKSALNGVSITPLLPLQLNRENSYLDRVYNLKKIK